MERRWFWRKMRTWQRAGERAGKQRMTAMEGQKEALRSHDGYELWGMTDGDGALGGESHHAN